MSDWSVAPSNSSTSIRLAKNSPDFVPVSPNIGVSGVAHNIVLSGIRTIEKRGSKRKTDLETVLETDGEDFKKVKMEEDGWIHGRKKKTKNKKTPKKNRKGGTIDEGSEKSDKETEIEMTDTNRENVLAEETIIIMDDNVGEKTDAGNKEQARTVDKDMTTGTDITDLEKEQTEKTMDKQEVATNIDITDIIRQSVGASEHMIETKMNTMEERMSSKQNELLERISTVINPLVTKIETIETRQDTLDLRQSQMEDKIDSKIDKLKEEILDEIRAEASTKSESENLAAFHYTLSQEIEKENSKLLIFGLKDSTDISTEAKSMLEMIAKKGGSMIEIKSVAQVGKTSPKGTTTVLAILGNQFQRNEILRNGRFIPDGISIDRCTPVLYREAYKKMKKKSKSYSKFFGTQTQISFQGHIMQLRYREEGKSFTILEEYIPSPKDAKNILKGNKTEGDPAAPSAGINATTIQEAKRFVLLTKLEKSTETEMRDWLQNILEKEIYTDMTEIKKTGKFWMLGFKDEAQARQIAEKYRDKTHDSKTFKAITFAT